MLNQIVIDAETADDSGTKFRLSVDANIVADDLTVAQAHLLIGEILDRIASSRPVEF
jgi:hypothetical protein